MRLRKTVLRYIEATAQSNIRNHANADRSMLKPFNAIPGPKPLPLVGNLWRYLPLVGDYKPDTLYENAQFNRKKYGPIVREQLTKAHTILHLFDPNDIESYFRQDGRYPHRRSHRALLKYRRERPNLYLDGGLFPENGPNWHRQRHQFQKYLMSKPYVASNLLKLDKTCTRTVKWMEDYMQGKSTVVHENFESVLYKWALSSSLSIFLNLDIDKLDGELIDSLMEHLDDSLKATDVTEIQTEKWITRPDKCPYYQQLVNSQEFLYTFTEKHVNDQLSTSKQNHSYLGDWLNGSKIDKRDIISFVIDSLMAGLHTTPYTMAFLLYHLSKNRSILDLLRLEISENLPDNALDVTIDHIDKLTLLRDCLKETMRLNPVSIGTGRLASQDDLCLRNHKIPAGTMIIAQTQTISRDGDIYFEPNEFKPERWANYRASPRHQRPSPFASLPFGFGPRACIGQRLAELQIKLLAARLLQRFDLTFENEISTKTTLIHTIDKPCKVTLKTI